MRAFGTTAAQATNRILGVAYWRGLVQAKGCRGRRPVSLAVDLAAGRVDAALAAEPPDAALRRERPVGLTPPASPFSSPTEGLRSL